MPKEAHVDVSLPSLAELKEADRALLERHFRGSLAWSVFDERGRRFAVRRAQQNGEWVDGSNGFHSDFSATGVVQRRVMVGLGGAYGFGVERGNVTRASARAGDVALVLEKYMDQPGQQSYLIVQGGAGVTLEVFEQSHQLERRFTRESLAEVEREIAGALAAAAEIRAHGYAAALVPAGSVKRAPAPPLDVSDGFQGGLYGVTAWVNPGEDGACFMRVYYTGQPKADDKVPPELRGRPPTLLSDEMMKHRTLRLVGWGPDPNALFRYSAGITVYEGDWEHRYPARFELWFRPLAGPERKLAELGRTISGWQR
jgi:hypothetical protein